MVRNLKRDRSGSDDDSGDPKRATNVGSSHSKKRPEIRGPVSSFYHKARTSFAAQVGQRTVCIKETDSVDNSKEPSVSGLGADCDDGNQHAVSSASRTSDGIRQDSVTPTTTSNLSQQQQPLYFISFDDHGTPLPKAYSSGGQWTREQMARKVAHRLGSTVLKEKVKEPQQPLVEGLAMIVSTVRYDMHALFALSRDVPIGMEQIDQLHDVIDDAIFRHIQEYPGDYCESDYILALKHLNFIIQRYIYNRCRGKARADVGFGDDVFEFYGCRSLAEEEPSQIDPFNSDLPSSSHLSHLQLSANKDAKYNQETATGIRDKYRKQKPPNAMSDREVEYFYGEACMIANAAESTLNEMHVRKSKLWAEIILRRRRRLPSEPPPPPLTHREGQETKIDHFVGLLSALPDKATTLGTATAVIPVDLTEDGINLLHQAAALNPDIGQIAQVIHADRRGGSESSSLARPVSLNKYMRWADGKKSYGGTPTPTIQLERNSADVETLRGLAPDELIVEVLANQSQRNEQQKSSKLSEASAGSAQGVINRNSVDVS